MKKPGLIARREYFALVHGVTIRAFRAFSDEELDYRPRPEMRSVRELAFHIYAQERAAAEAVSAGEYTMAAAAAVNPEHPSARPALDRLRTVDDLVAFARECHQIAEVTYRDASEEAVTRPIASPFGMFSGIQFSTFVSDELWHHRGQLYTYLRLLGKEPPSLYDYGS